MIHGSLSDLLIPIGSVRPYGRNPRRGNVEAIKESLERNGQYRPLVVNRRTHEVLAGNHTWQAARELGWTKVAATFVDVDEEQAKRIVLVDNRSNDLAGYDAEALAELLGELPELEGTGYDREALDELIDELAEGTLADDDADPPPLPSDPETAPGQLYRLGRHRLICADARDPEAYARLLGDERADLLWTDPPYGVDYVGKTSERLRIDNDRAGSLEALLHDAFAAIDAALADGAPLYVAHPAGPLSLVFGECFTGQGWLLRQTLVWAKDQFVLGRSDYHYRHEPILYGFKPGPKRLGRGGARWHGDHRQDSLLEVPRPRAAREHPTMKPPELIEIALRNSSRRAALVLDPFAGSGSTLVACERSARTARLVELDGRYCDVICERFERLTGDRAELVGE